MRPTAPLLLLTTLQGLAGGLALTVAIWLSLNPPPEMLPTFVGLLRLASLLAAAGGVASFFHMHRPRAGIFVLRRLKTSWLSREALTTGVFVVAVAIVAWVWPADAPSFLAVAWVAAALGLVAMWVTAMLYATIPAMLSWHSPITVLAMMGTGLVSGAGLAAGLAAHGPAAPASALTALWLLAGLAALAVVKGLQIHQFAVARRLLSAESGTGLPMGPWRLQDTGTSRPPYRTQTQVWPGISPSTRLWANLGFYLFLIALPAASSALTLIQPGAITLVGALSLIAGVLLERWMFFADATHSSRVWFQDQVKAPSRVATARKSPEWVAKFMASHPGRHLPSLPEE